MSETAPVRRILRFGIFEVDLQQRELRKDGFKVKLREQSFLLLEALLDRAGELVTRDELRNRLWPADTFVDFDHSLNAAMKRLRDALEDDPNCPRFIETVPKRGYRFLVPVNNPYVPTGETLGWSRKANSLVRRTWPWHWMTISAGAVVGLICMIIIILHLHRRENLAMATHDLAEFKVIPFTALAGQERSPSFSPDGSQIAFAWNGNTKEDGADRKFDIFLKVTGSERLVQITHHPAEAISLAWSPDGALIAFQRLAASGSGVYLVPALGGAERRLRSTTAQPSGLSWSPDGKWIAFTDAPVAEAGHQLNLISVDSLQTTPIPHISECQEETFPAFSPDGKQLAYFCIPQPGRFALYDVDPARGIPHLIGRYAGWAAGMAWSRDQHKLVIARHVDGSTFSELDEIAVSDGQLQKLPFGEAGGAPGVSTRGDKLTFETWHFTGVEIWKRTLIPPGAAAKKIIVSSTQASMFPNYSPDGKHILFTSNRTGTDEIWMSNADGTELLQISNFNSAGTPRWSPDGRRIAFDSRTEGHPGVYVANTEEWVPRKLRTNIEEMSQPFWSHDGKWIYFIGGADSGRIYRCPAAGGDAEALSSQAGTFPQESFGGDKVYFVTNVGSNPTLKMISLEKPGTESVLEGMPSVNFADWAVLPKGIYFLPPDKLSLEYFDFATRKVSHIMELSDEGVLGFSVSQDQRSIVYGRLKQAETDIMVVEHWR